MLSKLPENIKSRISRCYKTGCWNWTGGTKPDKTGKRRASINGLQAYRIIWEILIGQIPKGMNLNHKCHNTLCVNPKHLYVGTQKQNMQDNIKDGIRVGRIPKNHVKIQEMISLKKEGKTNHTIGKILGLDHSVVRHHLKKENL